MWRQAKVAIGDKSADQALVNFADKTADKPEWLEWPERVEPNAAIKVGDQKRYAGKVEACAGMFHVELLLSPVKPLIESIEEQTAAFDQSVKEAEAEVTATKKGTKR